MTTEAVPVHVDESAFTGRLYPYQREAVQAMLDQNLLLAYDMGTGKTLTTLTTIEILAAEGEITVPGIVLAPRSLLYQWLSEIHRWFPMSEIFVADGSPAQRYKMYEDIRETKTSSLGPAHHGGAAYLLMTYDTWVRDHDVLLHKSGDGGLNGFLILDEATAIKSFTTKRSKLLKRYRRRYLYRYALTGTPLENGKLEELYSILQWVDPSRLPKWSEFEDEHLMRHSHGWITGYKNVERFRERTKDIVLRKQVDDPDVASFMPKVIQLPEIDVWMDRPTNALHNRIAMEAINILEEIIRDTHQRKNLWWKEEDEDAPDGQLMSRIVAMRMLLDHPTALLNSAARAEDPDDDRGSKFALRIVKEGWTDKATAAPKVEALRQYLSDFFDAQPPEAKAVVFCSFVDVAEALHNELPWESELLTGEMNAKQRDKSKNRFLSDPSVKVFVSTDAGGYGLDLPVANLLVNYDLPWQPGLLDQRNARIRRASSLWGHVYLVNVITQNSIEERMARQLGYKSAIAAAALGDLAFADTEAKKVPDTPGSLITFLKDVIERSTKSA